MLSPALDTCRVRCLDVKGRKIEELKIPINKGFPDIEFFSRLHCRGDNVMKPLFFIV